MAKEYNSIVSANRKCAIQFAAWLTNLPELADLEDRIHMIRDLGHVSDKMAETGVMTQPFLPDLWHKMTRETMVELTDWTEEAMRALNLSPPLYWTDRDQSPVEKVQAMVDLLTDTVLPLYR